MRPHIILRKLGGSSASDAIFGCTGVGRGGGSGVGVLGGGSWTMDSGVKRLNLDLDPSLYSFSEFSLSSLEDGNRLLE